METSISCFKQSITRKSPFFQNSTPQGFQQIYEHTKGQAKKPTYEERLNNSVYKTSKETNDKMNKTINEQTRDSGLCEL